MGQHTLTLHASVEACFTGWPNAQGWDKREREVERPMYIYTAWPISTVSLAELIPIV